MDGTPQQGAHKETKGAGTEPVRASLAEKMTYAAIAAKGVRLPARAISPEGDKKKETASAVKSLTWRVRIAIEKRIKKIGEVPKGSL